MEIAWCGWPDERVLPILEIIPSGFSGEFMTNVDCEIRDRLMIVVLQRAERLQDVELGRISVNAGDAVADLSC